MSDAARNEVKAFIASVEEKMTQIVQEFAEGTLNRDQFQALYERYSSQLATANEALETGKLDTLYSIRNDVSSLIVRDTYEGKALGLIIYHHKGDTILETVGVFSLAIIAEISPRLSEISQKVKGGSGFLDWQVEKFAEDQWLLFDPGRYTTLVTLFRNQPSQQQADQLDRLHNDFEAANRAMFQSDDRLDSAKLAYPFASFVRKPS